ncbi:MutS-related protein [Pengzhenrongella sp.]|uniref:MutS-related protein n=1 Tax=Pengzhenrongella sp. TaxID=2888820 RepID=UPI002F957ADA
MSPSPSEMRTLAPVRTPFHSILFDEPPPDVRAEPPSFADLNLGQVVEAIMAGRQEYDLTPFFYLPLHTVDAVAYRQAVFRDLERSEVAGAVAQFATTMRAVRAGLEQAAKLHYPRQQESWFLDTAELYGEAVGSFVRDLDRAELASRGLRSFREFLSAYAANSGFTGLVAQTRGLKSDLAEVRYTLHFRGGRIKVSRYDGEADHGAEVLATFDRFKQGAVKDYRVNLSTGGEMNHVEAGVVDLVALLYPEPFAGLTAFRARHHDFLDPTIAAFDREVQFYLAVLEFVAHLERAGLEFCYPQVSADSKEVFARDTFDIALANKLVHGPTPVVRNDIFLQGSERIIVVSGPNQGGKTTFARMFAQLHYVAALGCLVPGREARLFLFDRLFTHFEREENLQDLVGKLQDELLRIHSILEQATPRSIIIMNEIFTSTSLQDAIFLGSRVLEKIIALDALCVCVTFVDELTRLGESTVSMVSTVLPDDPTVRTFTIARRPADGLSYAVAIADKYRLGYAALTERIPR